MLTIICTLVLAVVIFKVWNAMTDNNPIQARERAEYRRFVDRR